MSPSGDRQEEKQGEQRRQNPSTTQGTKAGASFEPTLQSPSDSELIAEAHFYGRSGPLPAPAELHQYNQVLPGLADRIVQLVEREQAYRIRVNERALNADIRSRYLGQVLGALLSAAALTTAVFFAYNGHPISGATIATTTIGVVGGLLYVKQRDMRRQQEQETRTAEGGQMELPLGE